MTLLLLVSVLAAEPVDAGASPPVLPELRRLARALEPQVKTSWVRQWLRNVKTLPHVEPTTFWCAADRQSCAQEPLPGWQQRTIDDDFVYSRITDPLGYERAYEVLAEHRVTLVKKRVLDFGYGNLGQLIMLAPLAREVHGVEVDALLDLAAHGAPVTVHHGFFGHDERLMQELEATPFDVWMSKNTLKRGYVKPDEGTAQIELGEDPLLHINRQLVTAGYFFIYNITGPRPETYTPMTDGRCPWSRAELEASGFEVIAHDADDTPKLRAMAKALEWGADAEKFTATWTLARKRVAH